MESHCCHYGSIFSIWMTHAVGQGVRTVCEHVAEEWLIVSSGKSRPGQKCSTVKTGQLALMRLQKGPRKLKEKTTNQPAREKKIENGFGKGKYINFKMSFSAH